VANPLATMLSGAMMLDFLGASGAGRAVEQAVVGVLTEATGLTPDLGGSGTTDSVTEAVLRKIGGS
jgi:isocitrate/isopropylmalate dehydrogenase